MNLATYKFLNELSPYLSLCYQLAIKINSHIKLLFSLNAWTELRKYLLVTTYDVIF